MNTNLKPKYLGNFKRYLRQDILFLLSENYAINAKKLKVYNNAMDNTVIDVDNKYILKIYETKSLKEIKESLLNFKQFKKFYTLQIIKNKQGKYLGFIYSKPYLLYEKIQGHFSHNLLSLINYISDFHKFGFSSYKEINSDLLISELSQKINFYITPNVKRELQKRGRFDVYKYLINEISSISLSKNITYLSYGFIHGDCSPSNIIENITGMHFLDFDCLHENFQFWDIIDLLLKYYNKPNFDKELKIIDIYIKRTGFYKRNDLLYFNKFINFVACYKGILMALSTEYYCFEKRKFTSEVLDSLFLSQVLKLINNIKYRLERLKCQEK